MFTRAIVKKPCQAMIHGITTANLGKPDYQLALQQHAAYVQALEQCGLKVTVLEADESYPDSCFVEDTAVLTPKFALITNPGAPSRKGEVASMIPIIKQFYSKDAIEYIQAPGTLEGGDVMMVGDHFYIGISDRTNQEGAGQFIHALEKHGMSGEMVPLHTILHLKTGLSYIENNNLLISGEFLENPIFSKFHQIPITADDAYSTNGLWINGKVLVAAGYPKTKKAIEDLGYEVLEVDTSEYRKIDGSLTCLSLRF